MTKIGKIWIWNTIPSIGLQTQSSKDVVTNEMLLDMSNAIWMPINFNSKEWTKLDISIIDWNLIIEASILSKQNRND